MATTSRPLRSLAASASRRTCPRAVARSCATPRAVSSSARSLSSASASAADVVRMPHDAPAFGALANELSAAQPCFATHGGGVQLLPSPSAFHAELLSMIARARRRILISTLYIGTEAEGLQLADALRTALAANPQLRVTVMLDYNRATRLSPAGAAPGAPRSTVHMLLPLLRGFGDRAELWLYRPPTLRGLLERAVPPRYNEGWGTWHAKYYSVDDDVIMSGANLARSYFTNRQDRYIKLAALPAFQSYLGSITRLLTDYSYRVVLGRQAAEAQRVVPLPGADDVRLVWRERSLPPRHWGAHAHATLRAFQQAWRASNAVRARAGGDTFFWPVLQAGYLGLREEEAAMGAVWRTVAAAPDVAVALTSGYFGLGAAYKRAVLESPAPVGIVAAAPESNGFFGSKGPSGLIPEGYTLLERRFWADAKRRARTGPGGITLKEWRKDGWTYHAKGLWIAPPNEDPFLTFIGSSNLSTRSLNLDTEMSLFMATRNEELRRTLGREVQSLNENSHVVDSDTFAQPERRVSLSAKVLVALGVEGML